MIIPNIPLRLLQISLLLHFFLVLAPGAQAKPPKTDYTTMPLSPLLSDSSSTATWAAKQKQLRDQWLERLGPFPQRLDLAPRILSRTTEPDHERLLIIYQTEPGIWTDAYLLLPKNQSNSPAPPAPAAVVFHATTSDHILQPVGLASAPTRHLALHLVRRGYVTLSPRCFINGYADDQATTAPRTPPRNFSDYRKEGEALLSRRPDWSGMGKMLWDGMRAVDYLLTRPEVDPDRIICVGHSLGAKESLYLAALDPRIRAGIFSEGGIGLRHSNWDAVWYLGPRIPPENSGHDHHELLALLAPRPYLIAGGGDADGRHTLPLVQAARPVYELLGSPDALKLLIHDKGHDIPPEIREDAYNWLDQHLQRKEE